ncbi:MAG TPA: protein kinase [Thermoanaerobaculia bacterium]|nr:protein kinase [Thermoanaerobaculia bacterium]
MIGETVSHYRITGHLGGGGMGVVWEAEDTRLGRSVAVKFLPTELTDDLQALERFQREARAASALNHPFICTVHDLGEHQGRPYLVMEKLEGRTLKALLADGSLPVDRVIELGAQIADALATAHAAGIVHRDLKPANVFVTRRGDAKVLDFGLAKMIGGERDAGMGTATPTATDRHLTSPGSTIGTVAYMSPEQARGGAVDARTDLFSLGVVLYEMATGRRPFDGESSAVVFSQILTGTPLAPSRLRPELPPALSDTIERLLEKNPELRLQTARDLLATLRRLRRDSGADSRAWSASDQRVPPVAATESVSGATPAPGSSSATTVAPTGSSGTTLPAAAPPLRRPRPWAVAALGAVLLGAVATWWAVRERPAPSPAAGDETATAEGAAADQPILMVVLPFRNLGTPERAYFAAGMSDEISSRLADVPGLALISRQSAEAYAGSGATARQIAEELGVTYILEGAVRWAEGPDGVDRVRITPRLVRAADDTQVWTDVFDRELSDVFALQAEVAERTVAALDESLLAGAGLGAQRPTENLEAYDYYLRAIEGGRWLDTKEQLRLRVDLLEKAVALDPEFALAHADLSDQYSDLFFRRIDPTQARLLMARRAAERALELDPELPEAHVSMALYHYRGAYDYERAQEELETALALRANDAVTLQWMGTLQKRQGRYEEALVHLRRAARLDPRDPEVVIELHVCLDKLGRHQEALTQLDRLVELEPDDWRHELTRSFYRAALTGDPSQLFAAASRLPDTAETAGWRATISFVQRRHDEELELLERDVPSRQAEPASYAARKLSMAWSFLMAGDAAGRRAAASEALEALEPLVEEDPLLYGSLADAHALLGRRDEALAALERYRQAIVRDRTRLMGYPYSRAEIHRALGEPDQAVAALEEWVDRDPGAKVGYLTLGPIWDPLRDRADFQALVRRLSG